MHQRLVITIWQNIDHCRSYCVELIPYRTFIPSFNNMGNNSVHLINNLFNLFFIVRTNFQAFKRFFVNFKPFLPFLVCFQALWILSMDMFQWPCSFVFISIKWETDILVSFLSDSLNIKQKKNILYKLGMIFVIKLCVVYVFSEIIVSNLKCHLLPYHIKHSKFKIRFLNRMICTHSYVKKRLHACASSNKKSNMME